MANTFQSNNSSAGYFGKRMPSAIFAAMDANRIAYLKAWDDFIMNILPEIEADTGAIPEDIRRACYSREGRYKYPPLGERRIEQLLTKYAPARYKFEVQITINRDAKTQSKTD
jgi:hypothetical protein